jgi:two-component system sensor histidine kinase BaeS
VDTPRRTMRPRLRVGLGPTSKLFLALLGAILLAAVAASVPVRNGLRPPGYGGFEDRAIASIHGQLTAAYERYGSWDFIRQHPRDWLQLLTGSLGAPEVGTIPPGPRSNLLVTSPPPPHLTLLDAQHRIVIGNTQLDADGPLFLRPIVVRSQVVGWLTTGTGSPGVYVLTARRPATADPRSLSWVTGLGAIAVAALAAVLLTRWMLRPIRHVAAATHRLAAGDYQTRLNISTHDEIGSLADDFNRLALALERNERIRRTFMADISHELRTPIAVLRGELEAIEDGVHKMTVDSIQSLRGEVEMIGKLVNDLYQLSLADVGALTYHMEDFDIAQSLQLCLRGFRERLAERCITLESDIPDEQILINGDQTRIQQLFGNLMENSCRYTNVGGRSRLSCRRELTHVVIDLHDSEPGVPEDSLPRLFERFYRVEASRNRGTGGAGLGLAICKSIVEAHGGTIGAQASPLGGLWIQISLSLAR